jgi:hypothetical protein
MKIPGSSMGPGLHRSRLVQHAGHPDALHTKNTADIACSQLNEQILVSRVVAMRHTGYPAPHAQ